MKLGELKKGQKAMIAKVGGLNKTEGQKRQSARLLEMGLTEGSIVEVLHEAPFGGDPIAVSVRGALVGMRRDEANLIEVEECL